MNQSFTQSDAEKTGRDMDEEFHAETQRAAETQRRSGGTPTKGFTQKTAEQVIRF
jgi:hypothetical protein